MRDMQQNFGGVAPLHQLTPPNPSHSTSLFVKGLAKGVNERQLHAIFSAFGPVVDCQVARHRSGRSAGFAVVTFYRREDAQRALLVMESAMLGGRRLNVRWYTPELQQSSMGAGDLHMAQALAAMLGAGTGAGAQAPNAKQPAAAPASSLAIAQQLLVRQLASAVAAQQNVLSGALGGNPTAGDPWGSAQPNNTPRMPHQGMPIASDLTSMENMKAGGGMLPGSWLDSAGNPSIPGLHSQLDTWARQSMDTSAPGYPRPPLGIQRSLEDLDLSACMPPASEDACEEHEKDSNGGTITSTNGSKWAAGARSVSSADCSLPASSPVDQSEDGSCSSSITGRHRRGDHHHHMGIDRHDVVHLADIRSEDGSDTCTQRTGSTCIQLPANLDPEPLYEKANTLAPAVNPLSNVLSANNRTGMPTLAPAYSAPMTAGSSGPLAKTVMPEPEVPLDLAAALSLTNLGLDGTGLGLGAGVSPRFHHMEAAIRQAQQADQMIAQLSAMRSQALLAYHAAAMHQSGGFPAQNSHAAALGDAMIGASPRTGAGMLAASQGLHTGGNIDLSSLVQGLQLHQSGVY